MKTQTTPQKNSLVRSALNGMSLSLLYRIGVAGILASICPMADAAPLPTDVRLTVTVNGENLTLNLHKRTARAAGFTLRTWDSANGYVVVPAPEIRTFRGTISEKPNALVLAAIDANNKLTAWCFDMDESHNRQWDLSVDVTSQLVTPATPLAMPSQATGVPVPGSTGTPQIGTKVPTGEALNGVKYGQMVDYDLAADIVVGTYNSFGQNVESTLADYELDALIYEYMMAKSNLIRVRLSATVIRKENFYSSDPGEVGLGALAAEWNRVGGPLTSLPWDCVWGSVGHYSNSGMGHGVGFGAGALFHENTHNWNASHLAYEADTMGGNKPSIGPFTADRIWAKRKTFIDSGELPQSMPFPDPIHPYTHVDAARVTMNTARDIDVLANDFDCNGDILTVSSFTTTTRQGGTVTLNPNGNLHYVPPANFVGKDMVVYTARDSSTMGLKTRDILHIEVVNNGLMAAYSFEETTGTSAADSTGLAPPADLNDSNFATHSVPSPLGRGIRASGWQYSAQLEGGFWSGILLGAAEAMPAAQPLYPDADGRKTPFEGVGVGFNRYGNGYDPMDGNYSFATWFRADDYPQDTYTYIASKWYHSEQSVGWDMRVFNRQLLLEWRVFDGAQGMQTLAVPYDFVPGKWYHVANVFDRATGEARLFLDGNRIATKAAAFPSNGTIFAGRSPLALGCYSKEKYAFDETRIYSKSLTDGEVQALYAAPGGVPRFLTPTLAVKAGLGLPLKHSLWTSIWTGGEELPTFSLVSGPAWLNVNSSGELVGTPGGATRTETAVVRMTDSQGNSADLTVNISVVVMLESGLASWWKLDETSGTNANDATGNPFDGTLLNGPTWGTGTLGGALTLNGTTQAVEVPPLNLNSNTVTISAWVKRNGNQAQWAGIVFCRDYTISGLVFGANNELRYSWNGAADTFEFSSGLTVPDNTWTLCSVVVEPNKATLYMQPIGGAVQSVVNTVNHTPVRFNASTYLGWDPISGNRRLKGSLDDVRIYSYALGAAQISYLGAKNITPTFISNPVVKAPAILGVGYSGSLAEDVADGDPGDTLTFANLVGPSWLSMAANGTLSGTPGVIDSGLNSFSASLTDAAGATSIGNFEILVTSSPMNGSWSNPAGGSWNSPSNWSSGNIASGANNTADFANLNLSANATITLDGARTLGNLTFGDTTPSHGWTLNAGSAGPLTLDVATGQPLVTVNNSVATLGVVIAGNDGLTKAGSGTLVLTAANTLSGITTISAGTLQVGNSTTTGALGSGAIVNHSTLAYLFSSTGSVSLPAAGGISGTGNLSATARDIKFNGNIALGGSQTYTQIGGGGGYQGIEIASSSVLTASSITLSGDVGKRDFSGNTLALDTSAANGPINLNISLGRNGIWYEMSGLTANAGTGAINVTGSGPAASGWRNTPVSLTGALNVTANVNALNLVTLNATATGSVSGGFSGTMPLVKTGSGVLTLSGANTYTGTTTISGGTLSITGSLASTPATVQTGATLSGTGALGGAVTVQNGGTVAPGVGNTGTLNINNTLTLSGTAAMQIGRTGGTLSADRVSGVTTVTYGGTLLVTNTGANALQPGDSFQLFAATTYAGSFGSVTLPALSPGCTWITSRLAVDGTITVYAPPQAVADAATVAEDGVATINVLANDSFGLSIQSVTQGAHGTAVIVSGTVKYTPVANWNGPDNFTYTVVDGQGATAVGSVTVTVTAVNDAPTFTANPFTKAGAVSQAAYSGTLTGDASDVDAGDTLTFARISGPEWLSIASNGSLSGTPVDSDIGLNSFLVSVTDGATSATATLQIPVTLMAWANPAGGSWTSAVNWNGGVIASGAGKIANFATLNLTSNTTVTLDGARTIGHLTFGDTTPSHNWTLAAGSGGPLTLDVTSGSPLITVNNQTATLAMTLAGSDGITKAGLGTLVLSAANTYTGSINVNAGVLEYATGGSISTASQITIGSGGAGQTGTMLVSGGSVGTSAANFVLGNNGMGNYTQSAGGFSHTGAGGSYFGNNPGGAGSVTISGGTFTDVGTAYLGVRAATTLTISDTADVKFAALSFGHPSATSGGATVNLNGGTLNLTSGGITVGNVTAAKIINLNGGVLKAGSASGFTWAQNANVTATVGAAGVTLDTNGNSMSIGQALTAGTGSGGLAKISSGALTLSGSNTYLGATDVRNGTLQLTGSLATESALNLGNAANSGKFILGSMGGVLNQTVGGLTTAGTGTTNAVVGGNAAVSILTVNLASGNNTFAGQLGGVGPQENNLGLTKSGNGTLTLSGINTFTGATTISGGTLSVTGSLTNSIVTAKTGSVLGGTGTLGGATAVQSGGTLSPGVNGTGTLTINNTLTLAGTAAMEIGRTGGVLSADGVTGVTTVTYGGTLAVTNIGTDPLLGGDTFVLFNAATYTGSFSTVTLPSLATGLVWDTSRLTVDGSIMINTIPVAVVDVATIAEDGSALISVLGNDSDADNDPLAIQSVTQGNNGVVAIAGGNITYTPVANWYGTDNFTYTIADSHGSTAVASVTVTVTSVNDVPTFGALTDANATEDVAFSGSVASAAGDVEAGVLTFSKTSGPAWLSVAANGALSGTPLNDDVGAINFVIRVTDGGNAYAESALTINVANVNDAPTFTTNPIIKSDATSLVPYSGSLAGNASDVDADDTLTFSKSGGPGWLVVASNGALSGTPPNTDIGANAFVVKVTDAGGTFSEAALNITVANGNHAPVFTVDPILVADATAGTAYTGQTLAGRATDSDAGDTITYSKVSGPAWLSVASDGTLTGTPPTSATPDTFVVRATDSSSGIDEAELRINVLGLPLPWTNTDIGTGMLAGSATHSAGTFTQAGSGALGGTTDKLCYIYQTLSGDGQIIARINSLQDTGTSSRVGVMIRDTLAANSRQIFMGLTSTGSYRWVRRTSTGGSTSTTNSSTGTVPNTWLKLVRTGNTITASKSTNGTSWSTVGSTTVTLATNCYIGLAVSSGSNTTLNTSQFSNVSVIP